MYIKLENTFFPEYIKHFFKEKGKYGNYDTGFRVMIPSFGKGKNLHKSHKIRLSGMPGMGLLISPSL